MCIYHEDATVAIVYRVTQSTGTQLILKICTRSNDYLREIYFLKKFAGILPVPRIIDLVQPQPGIDGAVLMDCLPGTLLAATELTDALAYEVGSLLARIHLNRTAKYGDLILPNSLSADPRSYFTLKFREGLAECSNHLPKTLLEQCRTYYDKQIDILGAVADGPCITHRDFRFGNLIVHEGKLSGIIDWSSARASFAQEDFCPIEYEDWSASPSRKQSFLAGYATVRPVPDCSAVMPLLTLDRAIAIIGFTVKRGTWNISSARVYQFNRDLLENLF